MSTKYENMEKLAREVIASWNVDTQKDFMDTLQWYALDRLTEAYKEDKQLFKNDVNLMEGKK